MQSQSKQTLIFAGVIGKKRKEKWCREVTFRHLIYLVVLCLRGFSFSRNIQHSLAPAMNCCSIKAVNGTIFTSFLFVFALQTDKIEWKKTSNNRPIKMHLNWQDWNGKIVNAIFGSFSTDSDRTIWKRNYNINLNNF